MLWLKGLIGDLSYGLRMMRKARLVSIAVTLTLAVGIGINTGIITIINGILLRPRTDSSPATFARLYAQYWSRGDPRELAGDFSPAGSGLTLAVAKQSPRESVGQSINRKEFARDLDCERGDRVISNQDSVVAPRRQFRQ